MYIKVYDSLDNQISEGTGLAPISIGPLNATLNEVSAPIAITIKADAGYTTFGNTVVSFVGASAAKFSVCATSGGTYAPTLTIAAPIIATGTTIYLKASASSDESPQNDVSVDVKIEAVVAAV